MTGSGRRRSAEGWLSGRARRSRSARLAAAVLCLLAVACAPPDPEAEPAAAGMAVGEALPPPVAGTAGSETAGPTVANGPVTIPPAAPPPTAAPATGADGRPLPTRPDWLGTRVLPTGADGWAVPQTTPAELVDRRFATIDILPPPPDDTFTFTAGPLEGDPLARSTWTDTCPVAVDELRYVTVSFWGFDGRPHTGELIVNASVVDDIEQVFRVLHQARFPIEEMRITTRAELDAPPIGDGNNTAAFVCRPAVGSTRFSEHAYGLAVDINPFHNPYLKGDLVLPELAGAYLDRTDVRPGMIVEGDVVVAAFDAAGWGWGGRWRTLKDYQHFAVNDR